MILREVCNTETAFCIEGVYKGVGKDVENWKHELQLEINRVTGLAMSLELVLTRTSVGLYI